MRCSRHLFVRTISTNSYAKIITQILVTLIKSQRLKQFLHSKILWTHQMISDSCFINTYLLNPQWRIRNNDIHYLLKYYTSLCKIFNILLYTLFYHVEKLHIIMYNIQQYNVYSPVSQNAEFKSFCPTNMIHMCQKIKYLEQHVSSKPYDDLNGSVIQKWCHY